VAGKTTSHDGFLSFQGRRSTCTCEDDAQPQADDWPTWVPDWRRHIGTGCEWGVSQHFGEWNDEHAASTHIEEEGEDKRESSPFALQTRGIIFGQATYVSPHHQFSQIIQQGGLRETRDKFMGMLSAYPHRRGGRRCICHDDGRRGFTETHSGAKALRSRCT
jgi:hypothetical protein